MQDLLPDPSRPGPLPPGPGPSSSVPLFPLPIPPPPHRPLPWFQHPFTTVFFFFFFLGLLLYLLTIIMYISQSGSGTSRAGRVRGGPGRVPTLPPGVLLYLCVSDACDIAVYEIIKEVNAYSRCRKSVSSAFITLLLLFFFFFVPRRL